MRIVIMQQHVIILELNIFQGIRKFKCNKYIMTNIFTIQEYASTMCGYFCIGFIDFMLKGISLIDYNNLFFPNEF